MDISGWGVEKRSSCIQRYWTKGWRQGACQKNFLELNVPGPTLFHIFFLCGYVEVHMTLDDFSWIRRKKSCYGQRYSD